MMQGELLTDEQVGGRVKVASQQEIWRAEYPVLESLDLNIHEFGVYKTGYIRVIPKPNAVIYECGSEWKSRFSDIHEFDEDNHVSWNRARTCPQAIEGVIECAATLNDAHTTPILHLVQDTTDLDTYSIGIALTNIDAVYVYPPEVTEIIAAYDAAYTDGSTYSFQLSRGIPTDVVLTAEDLEPWTRKLPPPTLVYKASI